MYQVPVVRQSVHAYAASQMRRYGSKADIDATACDVHFGPFPDSCAAARKGLLDHLVGNSAASGHSAVFAPPACFDWRAIANVMRAATMQRSPAAKNAGK